MGNWRRVQIVGTCGEEDVVNLRVEATRDCMDSKWNCLCNGGVCGLPDWSGMNINATGNLGERGYGPEDVAGVLNEILKTCPSLRVKVHCGGDYAADVCIATVSTETGEAVVGDPEIEIVGPIADSQMVANLSRILGHGGI